MVINADVHMTLEYDLDTDQPFTSKDRVGIMQALAGAFNHLYVNGLFTGEVEGLMLNFYTYSTKVAEQEA